MRPASHLTVYLSRACDMACAYCFVPGGVGALKPAALNRRLDAFVRAGGDKITFLGGEPLLRWGVLKTVVARLARLYPGVGVTVFTNGAVLSRGRAEELLRLGARIVLSLDGRKADNDKFRRLKSGGSAYAAALRDLPRGLRARLTVSAVVSPENAGRLASNIMSLYAAGFRSIAWAPDIKASWGPAEARTLSSGLLRVGRDYSALARAGRPVYEIANIYELLDSMRGGDTGGCASLTLSPEGTVLPCDKLLSAPAASRRRFSGSAGRAKFFAEAAAAGASPSEPLCPAGYYSLLRHAGGMAPSDIRAAMDLRLSFARAYGAAMRRLVKTLSRLPAFRRRQGLEGPL
ncbi:MAG TPA: hypothetical protein DDW67_00405 [Elusimicrobia bacterium]|nr:hypothetical protein [Elusimicrobiota bacterium]